MPGWAHEWDCSASRAQRRAAGVPVMVDPGPGDVRGDVRRCGWLLARVRRASLGVAHESRRQRGARAGAGRPDPATGAAPSWSIGRRGPARTPWTSRDVRGAPVLAGQAAPHRIARDRWSGSARDDHLRRSRLGAARLAVDSRPRGSRQAVGQAPRRRAWQACSPSGVPLLTRRARSGRSADRHACCLRMGRSGVPRSGDGEDDVSGRPATPGMSAGSRAPTPPR